MERQLELKDIVGYLPYRVKVLGKESHQLSDKNDSVLDKYSYELNLYTIRGYTIRGCLQFKEKLILYDISCLTEEIEHESERFVPFDKLAYEHQYCEKAEQIFWNKIQLKSVSYESMELLFKWHVDVFGLIPAGLAVDKKLIK